MPTTLETITQTYTSFSGADIKCVVGRVMIMELQGISYSVTREKAPIYTMGSPDPRSFSRGKRGIAGSMIFTIFDRDPLSALADDVRKVYYYYAKEDELREPSHYGREVNQQLVDRNGMPLDIERRPPIYDDQILPFDITINAQNEYGQMAVKRIYGVEILNSGEGMSIDDIVNERQATFVARTIGPWTQINIRDNMQGNTWEWDRVRDSLIPVT